MKKNKDIEKAEIEQANSDIIAVVEKYVELKKQGKEYFGCCPFHSENSPSFTVNPSKSFYHCLAAETMVITDIGVLPISDMSGSEHTILTLGGKWVSAKFNSYGVQKLFKIELSRNGVSKHIYATSGHRWFVRGRASETTTMNLKKGHRLNSVFPEVLSVTPSKEGIRHGIIFGDGTLASNQPCSIVNLHDEKRELSRFFDGYPHGNYMREGNKPYTQIRGLPVKYKSLPDLSNSKEYLAGFLAGYLATDGHVSHDGTIVLNSSLESNLRAVRDICTKIGVGTYGVTAQFRMGITGVYSNVFRIHLIKSTVSKDLILRSCAHERFVSSIKKFERKQWIVKSVTESDREEEVFCAEVPETHSFALEDNILTGNCFGCGAHGDAVSFVMEYEQIGFRDAVEGINGKKYTSEDSLTTRTSYKQEVTEEWDPIAPVPDNCSIKPKNTINRKYNDQWTRVQSSARWDYLDKDGKVLGYVYRFDLPTGGKEVIPQSYCVNKETGECEWRWLSFAKPRPIYGLDKLAQFPKAQVIIAEGEKACDAAQVKYEAAGVPKEKLIVISWPGGGKAVSKVDWSPLAGRSVGLWPDADSKVYIESHPKAGQLMPFIMQPGCIAMMDIYSAISETAKSVKFIVPPQGVADGWDLADPEPAGFNILEHTKAAAIPANEVYLKFPSEEDEADEDAAPVPEEALPDYDESYYGQDSAPYEPEGTDKPKAKTKDPLPEKHDFGDSDEPALEEELNNNGYFTILGYDIDTYYIFHRKKKQVMAITKGNLSDIGMIEIAHPNFWEEHFPAKGGFDKKAAAAWIFGIAHERGIYDPSRVRGRGAWIDKGRHVFHHGSILTIDGVPCAIDKIDSAYVYPMGAAMPSLADHPLSDDEGRSLLKVANMVRWTRPASAVMMAGWCMLAPICGSLKWRPHIWMTGSAGSGKSTIQRDFCGALTASISHYAQGNSTEAGIRQGLRADAMPVLIDELESNNEQEKKRVESVLSMIRQASSESQAKTMKGTVTGSAMNFHIRSMFCVASINTNLDGKADIDRLTALTIKPPAPTGSSEDKWDLLKEELHKIANDETISRRLLARCLSMMPIIHQNIGVFSKAAAMKFGTQRQGDQFGTLAAGAWCLLHSDVATIEQAAKMLDAYDWNEHTENLDQDDSTKALESVLSAKIRVGLNGDLSVFELIREAIPCYRKGILDEEIAADTLRRHGIRVDRDRDQLIFGTSISSLRQLVEKCSFVTDLRGQLLRIPGATRKDAMRFNGTNSKCVTVPLIKLMDSEAEVSEFPPI